MTGTTAILNDVGKKKTQDAAPARKAAVQLNIRVEQELADAFDVAVNTLTPESSQTAVLKMMMQAFILSPEEFVCTVKRFKAEHRPRPSEP